MIRVAEVEYGALLQAAHSEQVGRYVEYADKVIVAFETGQIDSAEAGSLLHLAETAEVRRHPMIREVGSIGCDLEDGCNLGVFSNDQAWQVIKRVLKDFEAGNLYPSYFRLVAYYSREEGGKIIQTLAAVVYRRDGKVVVECSEPAVKHELEQLSMATDRSHEDAVYLATLGKSLPIRVNELCLLRHSLSEQLVDPLR